MSKIVWTKERILDTTRANLQSQGLKCDYVDGHLIVKTPEGLIFEIEADDLKKYQETPPGSLPAVRLMELTEKLLNGASNLALELSGVKVVERETLPKAQLEIHDDEGHTFLVTFEQTNADEDA
jgi:hypothetical protein